MLVRTVFNIRQWITECPSSYRNSELYHSLIAFNDSVTLQTKLDNLIRLISDCEDELQVNSNNQFLKTLHEQCYQLARIFCNNSSITLDDLFVIYAKRRIDPHYLPGNLLVKEPLHLPPDWYTSGSDEIRARIPVEEKKLRRKYKAEQEEGLTYRKLNKQILEVIEEYQKREVLAKRALHTEKLRFDFDQVFKNIKACFDLLDKAPFASIKEMADLKKRLQQQFSNKYQIFLDNLEEYHRQLSKEECSQIAVLIENTAASLLEIIKKYETDDSLFVLSPLRKAIRKAAMRFKYHNNKLTISDIVSDQIFKHEAPEYFNKTHNSNLGTEYFDEKSREPHRVHIIDGKCYKFVQENGQLSIVPFSSNANHSHEKNGWVCFIVNLHGEIFVHSHTKVLHSSFMAGGPVLFAGEFKINNGIIEAISNYSGHYRPPEDFKQFADFLTHKQVDLSKTCFYSIDEAQVNRKLDHLLTIHDVLDEKEYAKRMSQIVVNTGRFAYSKRKVLRNAQLVESKDHSKKWLIAGLVLLTIVAGALLAGAIIISHGTALPVIAPFLAKFASVTAPFVPKLFLIGVTTLLTLMPLDLTLKCSGFYNWVQDRVELFAVKLIKAFGKSNERAPTNTHAPAPRTTNKRPNLVKKPPSLSTKITKNPPTFTQEKKYSKSVFLPRPKNPSQTSILNEGNQRGFSSPIIKQ